MSVMMTIEEALIPALLPPPVAGFCTSRIGGVSGPPYDSLNLGGACGDDQTAVEQNRRRVCSLLPAAPCWLRQVHGNHVVHLDQWQPGLEADAAWTDRPGQVVAVLTADCLPILVGDPDGHCVAAIHAGWRGLAAGVIERCIAALPARPNDLKAWIGPRICAEHYEVDASVRTAFEEVPEAFSPTRPGHWLADLPAIAVKQLLATGIETVTDSAICTAEGTSFFSYRRDGCTGRMATLAWIESVNS